MSSSSVYYKFRSQKEPSKITFDGTSISVWDIKKEIIAHNKMTKDLDFHLCIYDESGTRGVSIAIFVSKLILIFACCCSTYLQNTRTTTNSFSALRWSLSSAYRHHMGEAQHTSTLLTVMVQQGQRGASTM